MLSYSTVYRECVHNELILAMLLKALGDKWVRCMDHETKLEIEIVPL